MQKFSQNAENKRLSINFDGKQSTADELEFLKNTLLDRSARETDPTVLYDLQVTLTAVCSAIAAVEGAERNLAESKQMIANRRRTLDDEIEEIAATEAAEFQANIGLISTKIIARSCGLYPDYNSDDSIFYDRICSKIHSQLERLSFGAAREQSQEILKAARERREWVEVVSLPKPIDPRETSTAVEAN